MSRLSSMFIRTLTTENHPMPEFGTSNVQSHNGRYFGRNRLSAKAGKVLAVAMRVGQKPRQEITPSRRYFYQSHSGNIIALKVSRDGVLTSATSAKAPTINCLPRLTQNKERKCTGSEAEAEENLGKRRYLCLGGPQASMGARASLRV